MRICHVPPVLFCGSSSLPGGNTGIGRHTDPAGIMAGTGSRRRYSFPSKGTRAGSACVVIVALGGESAESLGLSPNFLKWPRHYHAGLTEILAQQRPSGQCRFHTVGTEAGMADCEIQEYLRRRAFTAGQNDLDTG